MANVSSAHWKNLLVDTLSQGEPIRFDGSKPQTWNGSSTPSIVCIDNPLSTRCEYCAGCDHLTVECPGLRHYIEPVRAFKERHGLATKPRNCTVCGEPEWSGRRIVGMGGSCGDCLSGGTPLAAQPIREPERIKYHAGQTPTWDWVGDT